jgi:hypothetical protein
MKKDISEKVERLEALEEKFGIEIRGVYCEMGTDDFDDNEYYVKLTAEVSSKKDKIDFNLEIKMAVYDEKNRVIAEESDFLFKDKFTGFDTISIYADEIIQKPDKIKIFPKAR